MFNMNCVLPKPVLILEDDPSVQTRIQDILMQFGYKIQELNFAQTIKIAQDIYAEYKHQLVLVDLGLPDGNGVDFIHHLRTEMQEKDIPIMVVSAWNTSEMIVKALSEGASGYVLKERDDFELMFAIRSLLRGGVIIDPFVTNEVLKNMHVEEEIKPAIVENIPQLTSNLSNRELEILNSVAAGNSSREISALLNISKFTVDCHIKNIYHKLSVNSRTKAINAAKKNGLII